MVLYIIIDLESFNFGKRVMSNKPMENIFFHVQLPTYVELYPISHGGKAIDIVMWERLVECSIFPPFLHFSPPHVVLYSTPQ